MSSIFLSHNSKDKEFVRKLALRLQNYNVKIWFDEAEIKVGDSLIKKIENGIDDMEYLGVILSPNSIDSEWVNKEVEMALNEEICGRKVKVLPLLYKKCTIPGFLKGKLYADFTTKKKFEESFEKLLITLGIDKNDSSRSSGEICILEKDFKKRIIEYFKPATVTIEYFEDLSGIDFIKVDRDKDTFALFTYWTKPTEIEILNKIFNEGSKKLHSIDFIDQYVVTDEEKTVFINSLEQKYDLPQESYPAQWTEISEHGESAVLEWEEWLFTRMPISLKYIK
ncbi:toll/interleukin-1 receptor domain-containing protein [Paenibacillus dauci]|uniref:toll/interleukin-1 receptor domain-containing protein n=1 Tax=Paenibacillus dauci TaxID=1567106 RepID=UPI000698FD71|nr:toll/interleukin-1 receptor domain-containing protein [Paenibacillus dauci]